MAIRNDYAWFRGEDILLRYTMTPTTDITGWTIACAVKGNMTDTTPLLTLTGTVTSAAAGIFTVPFTAANNTATLAAGFYPYSVYRTDSGSAAVLSEGVLTIKPSAKLA